MGYDYFSRNGEVKPIAQASVSLDNIEYAYGFGVYETIRVAAGKAQFLDEHLERLMESARIIALAHPFTAEAVGKAIADLIEKNAADTCNLKILLIGGRTAEDAELDILCLNPLFPDKKLYRDGAHATIYEYERLYPHAKTLNMLGSYLAYRKAREAGAYDALLVDREGHITEGTRTNFFCTKGKTLVSPPSEGFLLGVTQKHVLEIAQKSGFAVEERDIAPADLAQFDGAFLTSTSSKIMPLRSIDTHTFADISPALRELMSAFDTFLSSSK